MNYEIIPVTGFGRISTNIDINIIDYQIGDKLKIYYSLNNGTDRIIEGNIIYGVDVINNWIDDDYLINKILTDLGLVKL